jgi:hypothetical protein
MSRIFLNEQRTNLKALLKTGIVARNPCRRQGKKRKIGRPSAPADLSAAVRVRLIASFLAFEGLARARQNLNSPQPIRSIGVALGRISR